MVTFLISFCPDFLSWYLRAESKMADREEAEVRRSDVTVADGSQFRYIIADRGVHDVWNGKHENWYK